ncbi:MAG: cysteine--tRNA ligase [Sphingomonadales bacterium]
MTLQIYDSSRKGKRVFEPADPRRITLYVCGPTTYNFAHIGNARPPVVFDVLRRVLRHHYGKDAVLYARNITDIDDKIITKAAEEKTTTETVSDRYEAAYLEDMAGLGVEPPDLAPHATQSIDDILTLISDLIDRGQAYAAEAHVLFNVATYGGYGALSGRNREDMLAGARVEVAPYKRDPGDFVLWKPSTPEQPGWDSPWGRGRPGWHIECSAMIRATLGKTIDIHGGGIDLLFPHHENEVAQSCCANDGAPLARYWMHNGFVDMNSEKMSKSLGNVALIRDLLKDWPGEVLRYVLLSAQYRQPLDWTDDALKQAKATLDRLYRALEANKDVEPSPEASVDEHLLAALDDDLNTPQALSVLGRLAAASNSPDGKGALLQSAALLGLLQNDPETWRVGTAAPVGDIDALIEQRATAKKNKDFATADAIRDQLLEQGIILEDGPDGTRRRLR